MVLAKNKSTKIKKKKTLTNGDDKPKIDSEIIVENIQ